MIFRSLVTQVVFVLASFLAFGQSDAAPASSQTPGSAAKQSTNSSTKRSRKKKPVIPLRLRKIHRAFIASADLKPMAMQLVSDRTPAAYAGVEKFARSHPGDPGALAWLAIAYAHHLDQQSPQEIEALKKARLHADELGDYVDYHLGEAYVSTGKDEAAVEVLRDFDTRHPGSILSRDALVAYANALVTTGNGKLAIELLEARRMPTRADIELTLGHAYAAEGQSTKALTTLRNVYYTMPLSPQADAARASLDTLARSVALPPVSFTERKTRADLLVQGRRYSDAVQEFRLLQREAAPDDLPALKAGLGYALFKSGREREARELLEKLPGATEEVNAQRLYVLEQMAHSDQKKVSQYLDQFREQAPKSLWFADALLSSANMFLLDREYERAAALYTEIDDRFPGGKYSPYSHWRAAWLTYRLGRRDEAKYRFEQQVSLYPQSQEVTAALYWRGRIAEDEKDWGRARAYYQKLIERYRSYYYAEMARQRLALFQPGEAQSDGTLARVPALPVRSVPADLTPPADSLRAQKALLLENGGLLELAVRELQAANAADWALAEIAKIYQDSGQYYRALQTLKRAYPGYFALDLPQLPRDFWQTLFPRPYWPDLKRSSSDNGLDPYLVASLIRQESEFNPGAVSRANALGLMQLLPGVGKKLAKETKMRGFSYGMLLTPAVNLRLGTRYFRHMLDKYDGNVEYALAAYNAGSERVAEWRGHGGFRDVAEFVESIPFTETREYVQAIVRNAAVYRRLYGDSAVESASQH
ncbi:MAG: transglycosylase SLT domain-containing protein [Acidobacteriia bacterium]|nr:transglycosylase SLT domain-containing protein [Terriglobia bacterium]